MQVKISSNPEELGREAAAFCARIVNECIQNRGSARIVLSTGASQFAFLKSFITQKIPWPKVEMFHLDEYAGLSDQHPASFRKYLKERFLRYVEIGKAHLVSGEGDILANIAMLNAEIGKAPIDLGLIGIGENAHIAFNDPPADFETEEAYRIVTLDDACKRQQVGEGWFPGVEQVPAQAVTMTVHQILQSRHIVSFVPYQVKAKAVRQTLESEVTNLVPATILKTHPNFTLFLDDDSSSELDKAAWIGEGS